MRLLEPALPLCVRFLYVTGTSPKPDLYPCIMNPYPYIRLGLQMLAGLVFWSKRATGRNVQPANSVLTL